MGNGLPMEMEAKPVKQGAYSAWSKGSRGLRFFKSKNKTLLLASTLPPCIPPTWLTLKRGSCQELGSYSRAKVSFRLLELLPECCNNQDWLHVWVNWMAAIRKTPLAAVWGHERSRKKYLASKSLLSLNGSKEGIPESFNPSSLNTFFTYLLAHTVLKDNLQVILARLQLHKWSRWVTMRSGSKITDKCENQGVSFQL